MIKEIDISPAAYISSNDITALEHYAAGAEQKGLLLPEQASLIHTRKWLKMFLPERSGGLGYTLPQVLHTEEALAYADGSTGWVITLCSGAAWFIGFVDAGQRIHFEKENAWVAGSGAATGTAEEVDNGYIINGEWRYASGCLHASIITANCILTKNGIPRTDAKGNPLMKSFFFLRNEVDIIHNWNAMGMIATGSHGYSIKNLLVEKNRSFLLLPGQTVLPDRVYQYPFMQLAETTLVVNISGMANRYLELSRSFLPKTHRATLEESISNLQKARIRFYDAVETSWEICEGGKVIPDAVLANVSSTSYHLYDCAMSGVESVSRYVGLGGADRSSTLNRVWRDLYTACQHALFRRIMNS